MEFIASLHPKVIHFPIALLFGYVLFEILFTIFKKDYLSTLANYLLILGTLGALIAVLTGNQAEVFAEELEKTKNAIIPFKLIGEHENFATWTLFWFIGLLAIRLFLTIKKKLTRPLQLIILILALIGAYLVFETGEHGGKLVYDYGVGTKVLPTDSE